jgi:hypothetical protein
MRALIRLLQFTGFTLLEYLRSGRILVEMIAAVAFFYIFLTRRSDRSIDAEQLFTLTGLFSLALTLYTMSALLGLGDRPQGYVLLVRQLGRGSYLLGFYLAALVVVSGIYGLECIGVALTNRPDDLDLSGWLLGTLPLLLNVAMLAALLLMLSSLVFSPGWRLTVLGLIALAFSGNLINGPLLRSLPQGVQSALTAVQTVLSWPLVPPFSGFALSVSREYGTSGLVIVVAQASLVAALLGLALYAFSRRELIFTSH